MFQKLFSSVCKKFRADFRMDDGWSDGWRLKMADAMADATFVYNLVMADWKKFCVLYSINMYKKSSRQPRRGLTRGWLSQP